MKIESLNSKTLLVELTQKEMQSYNLTYESLENCPDVCRAIKDILSQASPSKRRGGVLVEALPTDSGGCFFIFTFRGLPRYKLKRTDWAARFEGCDDLLDFISALSRGNFGKSELEIYLMNGKLYCIAASPTKTLSRVIGEYSFGFGEPETVREHGKLLKSLSFN